MTDRIDTLTVVLERDIRDDDITELRQAVRQLRGVLDVVPHVADGAASAFAAESRERHRLHGELLALARRVIAGP